MVEAFSVTGACEKEVTTQCWFKNKLKRIVSLTFCEEQDVCVGLEDGVILMLDKQGMLKKQLSGNIDNNSSRLLKSIMLATKLLVVDSDGNLKFLSYDGRSNYKSHLRIKGLT